MDTHFLSTTRSPSLRSVLVTCLTLLLFASACSSGVVTEATTASVTSAPAPTNPPTTPAPATTAATAPATTATLAPTTVPQTTVPTTQATNPNGVESVANLLDPGAEPRQELRFDYTNGDTFTFDTEVSQTISQTLNGAVSPLGPEVITTLGQTGTVATQGDTYILESTTDSAVGLVEGDEALSAQVQVALDDIVGLVERRVIDPSGIVFEFELLNTGGIDPSVMGPAATAGENGVALAFPLEAVGVGGRWENVAMLEISGLDVEQVSTYEVISIDGPVVELAITTSQFVAPGSAMDVPGAEAIVKAWSAEGRGTMTVDLTSPVVTSIVEGQVDQTLVITADGEEIEIVQSILNGTRTTPR